FLARNVSQLGLHLYERDGDDVQRIRTGPVAEVLSKPNDTDTLTELIESLVGDWALYNEAYLVVLPTADGGHQMRVFPKAWVSPVHSTAFGPSKYRVRKADGSGTVELDAQYVIRFKGWTPADPTTGTSPVDTLRLVLSEQKNAREYRNEVWRNAGR